MFVVVVVMMVVLVLVTSSFWGKWVGSLRALTFLDMTLEEPLQGEVAE